jgi:hypothetical protein
MFNLTGSPKTKSSYSQIQSIVFILGLLLTGCAGFNSKLNNIVLQKAQLNNGTSVAMGYVEPAADWGCKSLATFSYADSSFQINPVSQSKSLKNNAVAYANKIGIKPNYINLGGRIGSKVVIDFYQCQIIKSYSTEKSLKFMPEGFAKPLRDSWAPILPLCLLGSKC